ncbi:uncharacterized protein V6R79_003561 [Siganus canaliculatus]
MPGSVPSMAVQKKQSAVPPSQGPLSAYTIENQRKANGPERTGDLNNANSQAKKAVSSVNQYVPNCNTAGPRIIGASNGANVDERLRAARERREEHQKLLASRELSRLEREQRARNYYEQQLKQRKRRLQEQRLKEEQRRAAVEEKRKQRLKEEKERHESAVRRTLEKSQKAQQNHGLNSRGRKLAKYVPRRLPLTTWEKNLVSRLLTPTCSYLARSKSADCQSGEEVVHICRRAVSFHSMNTTVTPSTPQQRQLSYSRPSASPSPNNSQYKSISLPQIKSPRQQDATKKNSKNISNTAAPPLNIRRVTNNKSPVANTSAKPAANTKSPTANRSIKSVANNRSTPVNVKAKAATNTKSPAAKRSIKPSAASQSRSPSPSPERKVRRSISRHSTPLQLELPSVPEEDVAVCSSVQTSAEGQQEIVSDENPPDTLTRTATSPPRTPSHSVSQPTQVVSRPSAGTTDPEEASRLMAEKRREARLQREKEELERSQREEAERRSREELECRRAEERARQQAEAERLIEEKRRRDEEEQRQAEEERAQAMREAALLQKQREEEQARERAKAEQLKQERELLAQKEEAARQARKKRLEEIMRRTRRTDSPDTKSAPVRSSPDEAQPKENTEPALNGTIEEAAKLPVGTKTSQLGLNTQEDVIPVVAFKERRSLRTLAGLEEIQTHQRAEVI